VPELPFRFHVPVKAFEKADKLGTSTRRIGGLVTSPNRDLQGETIDLDGLDFGDFNNRGWFNDNHGKSITDVIGIPTVAAKRVHKGQILPTGDRAPIDSYWVEGVLVGPKGQQVWQLAKDLEGTGRSLGYSIEGGVIQRDPIDQRHIGKAKVRNVAVTHCPVNTETEMRLLSKALAAGSSVANPGASPGEGFPLRAESLDPEVKWLTFAAPIPSSGKKPLSKSKALQLLRSKYPKINDELAEMAWHVAKAMKAAGLLGSAS